VTASRRILGKYPHIVPPFGRVVKLVKEEFIEEDRRQHRQEGIGVGAFFKKVNRGTSIGGHNTIIPCMAHRPQLNEHIFALPHRSRSAGCRASAIWCRYPWAMTRAIRAMCPPCGAS
jgi:hypothetical protein